jgi:hypothetical protein
VPDADGATAEIEEVQAWAAGLGAVHARIAPRFVRAEPRRRVLAGPAEPTGPAQLGSISVSAAAASAKPADQPPGQARERDHGQQQ